MTLPRPAAHRAMVRDLLRTIPARARRRMSELDMAGLTTLLHWADAQPDCETVPLPHFTHKGIMYHFPRAKGSNLTCIEFPMADEYYTQFVEAAEPDQQALMCLLATLCREQNYDDAAVLRLGDARVPLHSREEVEARAMRLQGVPPEYCLQALLWFAGMKLYVSRVYGPWLFEQDEEEEEDEDNPTPSPSAGGGSPNFGWWGIYQDVAEAGVFGHDVDQVHQKPFHDVCVYLVRKRVAAEQTASAYRQPAAPADQDD